MVVVTAGQGVPTRRAPDQPFVSIAPSDCDSVAKPLASDGAAAAAAATVSSANCAQSSGPLAALAGPLELMNAAVAGLERVLGRRLFPITISTFDRAGSGPYAIWDAAAGALLLDRQFASLTWSYDKPEVSYVTGQLASRVFDQMTALLRGASAASGEAEAGTAAEDSAAPSGAAAEAVAAATAAAAGGSGNGLQSLLSGLLLRGGQVATGYEGLAAQATTEATGQEQGEGEQQHRLLRETERAAASVGTASFSLPDLLSQLPSAVSSSIAATAAAGPAAAAALGLAAAALGAALPAAFSAAPPLWFCILCPSVLGLLAPVLINVALNQVAGALCSQLHLGDDACFDLLLGALGVGFILSLASAIPIFFACRLPECAGRNVTAALRALRL